MAKKVRKTKASKRAPRVEIDQQAEDTSRFLGTLFGADTPRAWVTGFTESPLAPSLVRNKDAAYKMQARMWGGGPIMAGEAVSIHGRRLTADANQYVCISVFHAQARDETRGSARVLLDRARRRKSQHERTCAVMMDDIGVKVLRENIKLPLTAEIETSPGNRQGWYALDPKDPDARDGELCARLIERMVAAGLTKDLTDPGMKGVTRYGRLPNGINNKPGRAPWRVVLRELHPERVYKVREIADAYGLDLSAPPAKRNGGGAPAESLVARLEAASLKPSDKGDGKFDITCPWIGSHGDRADSGAAYFLPSKENNFAGGFVCHHGHCKDKRTIADVYRFLTEREATAAMAKLGAKLVGGASEDVDAALAEIRSRVWTLEELQADAVMLQDGAMVTSLARPYIALPFGTMKTLLAASVDFVEHPRTGTKKAVYRLDRWNSSTARMQVWGRTHAPGAGPICEDPLGRKCVNLWRAREHVAPPKWAELVKPFMEHVEYLVPVGAERERFLDWLAHAEQRPGERPHAHYLMRTRGAEGIGRNWVGAVLARVWKGEVALSVDLMAMLAGGFNGLVAGKVLGVVDELHTEQAGISLRKLGQALKSELTASQRNVDPKYGRQYVEWCCTRWLMLSNHVRALPIAPEDRRLVVIENPNKPRAASYYTKLYAALEDAAFIASVREFLRSRDVSAFNPGEHAAMNEAKRETIEASMSPLDIAARGLVGDWPFDLITTGTLRLNLGETHNERIPHNTLRAVALDAGLRSGGATVKLDGESVRYWIVRNPEKWIAASAQQIRFELARSKKAAS